MLNLVELEFVGIEETQWEAGEGGKRKLRGENTVVIEKTELFLFNEGDYSG